MLSFRPFQTGSLCGISPPFSELFPTTGQVTYALLSRPPLTRRSVRLACVRRAASVRPEPGSNPHEKISIQVQFWLECFFGSLALPSTIQMLRCRQSSLHRSEDAATTEPERLWPLQAPEIAYSLVCQRMSLRRRQQTVNRLLYSGLWGPSRPSSRRLSAGFLKNLLLCLHYL